MQRIVIVGGGVAGIVLATHLGRRLARRQAAEILLIDKNRAHVWKPMLHTFAAATENHTIQNVPFVAQAERAGFRYWPGALRGLDRGAKTLKLGPVTLPDGESALPGREVPYDKLVLAVGSLANDFATPGVAEHCHSIDDIGEAERFSALLRSRIVLGIDARRDVHVAIVGGGATGVGLAAVLRQHMDDLSSYAARGLPARLRITLIETAPRILGPFSERVSRATEEKLRQLGIDVMAGTQVVGADAGGVTIEGGRRVEADLMVWAAGVKAPPVLSELGGLEVNRKGQVVVRPTLQTEADDDVFALGDCAECTGRDGEPLPTTAQVARQQAVFLARSLGNHIARDRPLREFAYRERGKLVSLGPYAAYGTLASSGLFGRAFLEGRLAQTAHAALYRMHQLDLNGPVKGGVGWLADSLMRLARPRIRLS